MSACVFVVFRCCAHIAELEHAYFSCGDNQMSLPELHPEALRPLPATSASDSNDVDCREYVIQIMWQYISSLGLYQIHEITESVNFSVCRELP